MKPSLQTSLLRRNQGKQPKFRKERRWWHLLKQRILIFVLVLAAGYAIYWLQTSKPFKEADKELADQVEQFDASLILKHKKELPTKELLIVANKMDLDTNAPLPVKLEWVKNRMEISDQLLAKSNDDLAIKEGTLYRLESLQLLSNLNRKHELGNDTVEAQLYELCEANLSHSDPEVSKIAAVAIMMTSMHQFSNEPTESNRKDALATCEQIAKQLGDDHEIALAIFKYAKLMKRANSMVDDSVHFFNTVVERYLDSKNKKASDIARNAYRELLFGDSTGDSKFSSLLIAGINDRFRNKMETVESELENRIRFSMLEELVDENAIDQQLEMLEVLFTNNRHDKALELLETLGQFYSSTDRENLETAAADAFGDFRTRLNAFGGYLELGSLDFENSAAGLAKGELPTLLVFWSPRNSKANRFLNMLNNLSVESFAQCIVVACDIESDESEQIGKLAKEIPNFKFTVLNTAGDMKNGLEKSFPVPKVPYLVLLDRDWNVVGINPHPRDLSDRIVQILNN